METKEDLNADKRKEFKGGNNIEKLSRRMYSRERKGFLPWRRRVEINKQAPLAKDDWDYKDQEQQDDDEQKAKVMPKRRVHGEKESGTRTLLIVSIVFFVVASIGAFVYLRIMMGTVYAGSVDIAIEGSSSIAAGDVLELQVLVSNRNDASLELADMVVTYPDGTTSPADFSTSLKSERIPLGTIDALSARRGAIRAVIFGNDGQAQEINVELQYRLRGSNVIYSRTSSHTVLISSDAMSISVDGNTELTPGQNTPITLTVRSDSSTILNGVFVDMVFPFGFTLVDSSPMPSLAQGTDRESRWLIGSLRPGEERTIQISGALDGQAGDVRNITMRAGIGLTPDSTNSDTGTVLATTEHAIKISKPFLAVTLDSNGEDLNNFVAYAGDSFDVTVNWHNTLDAPINDATIAITLGGSALNKAGVDAGNEGFYRSVDSLILWDSKTVGDALASVAPGASGKFRFRITPLPRSYLEKIRTPVLSFAVHAAGNRLSESNVPEVLKNDSLSEVKIGTDTELNAYSLFHSSPFGERGPLPPKVEYETTYGIVWEVSNTTSDIKDAVVRAELPHYVRWVGITLPASEQIIYNKADNTLEWNLGTVKAGTGTLSAQPRRVSFAVGLVPSATQIGDSPDLVRNQTFTAIDSYTGAEIYQKIDNVNTKAERDENYIDSESRVVK